MKALELTFYGVNAEGVIIVPGIPEPKIRADVFEQVDVRDVHVRKDLIVLINACLPLAAHFRRLSMAYLDAHAQPSSYLDKLATHSGGRSGSQQLIQGALRRDPEEGWQQWIDFSGDTALEGFLQIVRDWLDEEIDWREGEYFDVIWNGQAAALAYFDDLPYAILKALGVKIIDGDVPGSSYRAAELVKDIEKANQIAELLELDLRFEAAQALSREVCHD
jgi:hypothetical protein